MRTVRLGDRTRRPSVPKLSAASESSLADLALVHLTGALERCQPKAAANRRELSPVWIEGFGFSNGTLFC